MSGDWVEVEGSEPEEARARLLEALGVDEIDAVEIEELRTVRRFLGVGGKSYKIRGRLRSEFESVDDDLIDIDTIAQALEEDAEPQSGEADETEESTAAPSRVDPERSAHASRDKIETPNGIVTFESPYRPWIDEGAGGIYLHKRGRGYRNRLYSATASKDNDIMDATARAKPTHAPSGAPDRFDRAAELELDDFDDGFIEPEYADDPTSPISEELRRAGVDFVRSILSGIGVSAELVGYRLSDRLLIDIAPSASGGLIIGRKGATLDAIQYLTDIALNRSRAKRARVIVDAERYRARRTHKIAQLARRSAEDAKRASRAIALAPMKPSERRVIHTTLADDPAVTTASEGEGARRRVVIKPVAGNRPRPDRGKPPFQRRGKERPNWRR